MAGESASFVRAFIGGAQERTGNAHGLDAAKALALGADAVGIAGPFLRAADKGPDEARAFARQLVETLRIAMFCIGAKSIAELRDSPRLLPVSP